MKPNLLRPSTEARCELLCEILESACRKKQSRKMVALDKLVNTAMYSIIELFNDDDEDDEDDEDEEDEEDEEEEALLRERIVADSESSESSESEQDEQDEGEESDEGDLACGQVK